MTTFPVTPDTHSAWQQPILAHQSAPPGSPSEGDRYIVAPTGTGAWEGHDNAIAWYYGAAWTFYSPASGWEVYDRGANVWRYYTGSAWSALNVGAFLAAAPAYYERSRMWKNKGSDSAANRRTLVSPDRLGVNINDVGCFLSTASELDLNTAGSWDTTAGTDYTTAANRAGKDFYIYACLPVSGNVPVILLSAAATYPYGFSTTTSRKIGGFHCECVNVGTISGHALTGYLAGDILPRSVWDLKHRSAGMQAGMVWAGKTDFDSAFYGASIWVAIYLASGTGTSTASVNAATISDTRNWMDFVDDFAAIGCRMLEDDEFQAIAAGSNEETNIAGSADPGTTGGHVDTAGRRMVSHLGCEDCCGAVWQWLRTQSHRSDYTAAWSWYDLPGTKGSLYNQAGSAGTGDVKLLAGGAWNDGSACGSRSRHAYNYRWNAHSRIGGRFAAAPQ